MWSTPLYHSNNNHSLGSDFESKLRIPSRKPRLVEYNYVQNETVINSIIEWWSCNILNSINLEIQNILWCIGGLNVMCTMRDFIFHLRLNGTSKMRSLNFEIKHYLQVFNVYSFVIYATFVWLNQVILHALR